MLRIHAVLIVLLVSTFAVGGIMQQPNSGTFAYAKVIVTYAAVSFEGSFSSSSHFTGGGSFDICVNSGSKRMQGVYSKIGVLFF